MVFHEFPKMVYLDGAKDGVIVQNKDEEAILRGIPLAPQLTSNEYDVYNNAPSSYELDDLLPCDIPSIMSAADIPEIPELQPISPEEVTKDSLQKEADSLGVIYDKRWGADKLQSAINEYKIQMSNSGS